MNKEKVLAYITPKTAEFEGFSSKVYQCPAGYDTIGYGRNIEANPLSKEEREQLQNGEISKEVAMEWLKKDLEKCYEMAYKSFLWFRELVIQRQGAIIDMIYNLGFNGFRGFKKMIKALEEKDFIKAAMELEDSRYFRQTGRRAKEISRIIQIGV